MAVLCFSAAQAAGNTSDPLLGCGLGIVAAVILARFIYDGAVRQNLSKFFSYTGYLHLIVVAGVLL